jgi:hypothetical protein
MVYKMGVLSETGRDGGNATDSGEMSVLQISGQLR